MLKILPLLLILLAASSPAAAQPSAETSPLRSVTIAHWGKANLLLYLPLYIAMEEGIFAKHGLEVKLKYSGNDDQVFATIIGGDAEFGIGDPVFAAVSRERGFTGKVVAMMVVKLGLSGYTNKKDIPVIDTPAKLSGLRIASFPAPSTTYTLVAGLIKKNKLSDTKIVQSAIGGQLATLEAGDADIVVDLEPSVSVVEAIGYRVVFSLDAFTEFMAITGITTSEEVIAKNPEVVQKLVNGLQEAMTALHKDRVLAVKVAQKVFPKLSADVATRAVNRNLELDVYPKSVIVEDAYWQRTLQTRLDSGELKKPQPTAETVENRFAAAAAKQFAK